MRVTVVGGGVMGLCIARSLLAHGADVTLVDPMDLGSGARASSDDMRLIRLPYGRMSGYQRMVRKAYPAWERLWKDLGERHYRHTGVLLVGGSATGWVAESMAGLEAHEFRSVSVSEQPIPGYEVPDGKSAWIVPEAGVLMANKILSSLSGFLADVERVSGRAETVDPFRGVTTLRDGRTIEADRIIVATGAWTWPKGSAASSRRPSRQTALYLSPPPGTPVSPFLLDLTPETGFYFVPSVDGYAAKLGTHSFSMTGHPDQERSCTAAERATLLRIRQEHLSFSGGWKEVACLANYYDVSPDERFICVTRDKAIWLGGFSGHGFKFAPLIGEVVADHLNTDQPDDTLINWMAGRA